MSLGSRLNLINRYVCRNNSAERNVRLFQELSAQGIMLLDSGGTPIRFLGLLLMNVSE